MSRSTIDGGPRRPTERTRTVLLDVDTSTLLRLDMTAPHAHVVLIPGMHHDLAAEVIDVEPGTLLDRDRRVAAALSLSLSAPLSLLRESERDGG